MNQILEQLSPTEILGLTIIGEARGEPIEGQVAVASVIRNRLHDNPSKYHSYNDVCLEPEQFSCWNENDPNYAFLLELANQMIMGQKLTDPNIRQCMLVAGGIIDWSIIDNTGSAKNYMTRALYYSNRKPSWAGACRISATYGKQVFLV